jgi:hypothetical protein
MTDGADMLTFQLTAVGSKGWEREYVFHPTRKWRLDVAFPAEQLGVEVEGFAAGGKAGRHQRVGGFNADCEKYAELAILGWRLIRCTTRQVKSGEALQWIERALKSNLAGLGRVDRAVDAA